MFKGERELFPKEPQNWLSKPTLKFLESFPGINIPEIGKLLGTGFYHYVYTYGSDQVLKIPRFYPGFTPHTAEERIQELEIMKEYFPSGSIAETSVISSSDNPYYCILQEKVEGFGFIGPDDLGTDPFQGILEGNRRSIEKKHATFDFFGFPGIFLALKSSFDKRMKPCLTNILKVPDNGLLITDTDLYFFDKPYSLPHKHTAAVLALLGNRILMEKYFGIDILPENFKAGARANS